jgi:hypothetical protein
MQLLPGVVIVKWRYRLQFPGFIFALGCCRRRALPLALAVLLLHQSAHNKRLRWPPASKLQKVITEEINHDVLARSVVSLIVSFAAYRRSSCTRHDLLERASADKAERSRSTAQSSADTDAAAARAGYERDLQRIADLRACIAALGKEALEEIRQDLKSVRQRVDRLAERAAREIAAR